MKTKHVVCAVIRNKGRVFCTQRGYGEFKDLWEFPGGKKEKGETGEEALIREILEEHETEIRICSYIDTVEYDYPDFHLSMSAYLCEVLKGDLTLVEAEDSRWLLPKEFDQVDWLPADRLLLYKISESI